MFKTPCLAPSLLSADFSKLLEEIKAVESEGIEVLHVDVMDGHFVPNMTIGPVVVESLRSKTKCILDCHLMVNEPQKFIPWFAKAGADFITFHLEATTAAPKIIAEIKAAGCKAGISIKPATPLNAVLPLLSQLDLILVMSVNPGFGGQSFMQETLKKVEMLAKLKKESGFSYLIEIDGGINEGTAKMARAAGTEIFVAGSAIFGAEDRAEAIRKLNQAIGA